jgi:hypothetical protein
MVNLQVSRQSLTRTVAAELAQLPLSAGQLADLGPRRIVDAEQARQGKAAAARAPLPHSKGMSGRMGEAKAELKQGVSLHAADYKRVPYRTKRRRN